MLVTGGRLLLSLVRLLAGLVERLSGLRGRFGGHLGGLRGEPADLLLGGLVRLARRSLLGGLGGGILSRLLGGLQRLACLGSGGFGPVRVAAERFFGGFGRRGLSLLQRLADFVGGMLGIGLLRQGAGLLAHPLLGGGSLGRRVGLTLSQRLGRLIGLGLLGRGFADLPGQLRRLGGLFVARGSLLSGLGVLNFLGGLLQLSHLLGRGIGPVGHRGLDGLAGLIELFELLASHLGQLLGGLTDFLPQLGGGFGQLLGGGLSLLAFGGGRLRRLLGRGGRLLSGVDRLGRFT